MAGRRPSLEKPALTTEEFRLPPQCLWTPAREDLSAGQVVPLPARPQVERRAVSMNADPPGLAATAATGKTAAGTSAGQPGIAGPARTGARPASCHALAAAHPA